MVDSLELQLVRAWARYAEHLAGKHNQKSHANRFGSAGAIKGNVKRLGKDKEALKRMAARARGDKDFQAGVKATGDNKRLSKNIKKAEDNIRNIHTHEESVTFDKSGKIVFAKTGGKSEVNFSEDEVKKVKGNILTHNHPSTGGSFSMEDISFALNYELAEIRAVGVQRRQKPDGSFDTIKTTFSFKTNENSIRRAGMIMLIYDEQSKNVQETFWRNIGRGIMTPSEAESIHFHTVWSAVKTKAALEGIDFDYTATEEPFYGNN